MYFLQSSDLDKKIRSILSEAEPRCAVAFWGAGVSRLFNKKSKAKIICNLLSGSTNPYEIAALQEFGHEVRQNDFLHAKVYIGSINTIITSANASANGLGLEAGELAHWIEVGTQSKTTLEISMWFDKLWEDSQTRNISQNDIDAAKDIWKLRRSRKPELKSFLSFDFNQHNLPLIYPYENNSLDYEINQEIANNEIGGNNSDILNSSIHIDNNLDTPFLEKGAWVLWWAQKVGGLPDGRKGLEWGQTTRRINKVWRFHAENRWRDAVLCDQDAQPVPFNCNEKKFLRLFKEKISEEKYRPLRGWEEGEAFFYKCEDISRTFWKELHQMYVQSN